jgi:hypothetical protein
MRAGLVMVLGLVLCGAVFHAPAQDMTCSTSSLVNNSACPDQGAAFAAANAVAAEQVAKSNAGSSGWCPGVVENSGFSYTAYVTTCDNPGPRYETRVRSYDTPRVP